MENFIFCAVYFTNEKMSKIRNPSKIQKQSPADILEKVFKLHTIELHIEKAENYTGKIYSFLIKIFSDTYLFITKYLL